MCVLGQNDWCTPAAPCFSCEDAAHTHTEPVDGCRTCQLRSVQLSPAATPSKARRLRAWGAKRGNEWERGIPTDGRGMPWLRPGTVAPVGTKEYGQDRRKIESARRQLANA